MHGPGVDSGGRMSDELVWDFESGLLDDNSPGMRVTVTGPNGVELFKALLTAREAAAIAREFLKAADQANEIAAALEKPS